MVLYDHPNASNNSICIQQLNLPPQEVVSQITVASRPSLVPPPSGLHRVVDVKNTLRSAIAPLHSNAVQPVPPPVDADEEDSGSMIPPDDEPVAAASLYLPEGVTAKSNKNHQSLKSQLLQLMVVPLLPLLLRSWRMPLAQITDDDVCPEERFYLQRRRRQQPCGDGIPGSAAPVATRW
jgi:hypothetical protein